jgi:type IV secretion system protein VirD4
VNPKFIALVAFLALLGLVVHVVRGGRRHELPRNRVLHQNIRLHLRLRPNHGHASLFHLWHRFGRLASYRESSRTRPGLSRRERLRHPQAHSLFIGRAQWWHTVRQSIQEHGLLVGPPRAFKSALMGRLILAAPGAVVSTSSKPDMFAATARIRSERGPVYVFNPQGIGGIPSTVRWNPLEGCMDPATAIRRGDAFAAGAGTSGTEDAEFWKGKAADGLRAMFRAAAEAEQTMHLVNRWSTGRSVGDAVGILAAAGSPDWAAQLAELTGPAEKTTATIRMVISRALGWMNDPAIAASVLPVGGNDFDVDRFLRERGTIYMIARAGNEESVLAPLFAALAAEIHERALQIGAVSRGGRLDPPLTCVLDEVTRICPIDLPGWMADAGGQGVSIWAAFHGMSQLRSRWKAEGAQTIWNTSNAVLLTSGIKDMETLDAASKLTGDGSWKARGQEHYSEHPVMTPAMIRQIPSGWALVLRGNNRPVVAKLARYWKDRAYRRLGAAERFLSLAELPSASRMALELDDELVSGVIDGYDAEHGALDGQVIDPARRLFPVPSGPDRRAWRPSGGGADGSDAS